MGGWDGEGGRFIGILFFGRSPQYLLSALSSLTSFGDSKPISAHGGGLVVSLPSQQHFR